MEKLQHFPVLTATSAAELRVGIERGNWVRELGTTFAQHSSVISLQIDADFEGGSFAEAESSFLQSIAEMPCLAYLDLQLTQFISKLTVFACASLATQCGGTLAYFGIDIFNCCPLEECAESWLRLGLALGSFKSVSFDCGQRGSSRCAVTAAVP